MLPPIQVLRPNLHPNLQRLVRNLPPLPFPQLPLHQGINLRLAQAVLTLEAIQANIPRKVAVYLRALQTSLV